MKIGIISSKNYQNDKVIYDLFYFIKTKVGNKNCVIVGAANDGTDSLIKELAISNQFQYVEFNPSYTGKNEYSYEKNTYYDKNYHISHLYDRYNKLFRYCDKLIIFKLKKDTDFVFTESINKIPKSIKHIVYES